MWVARDRSGEIWLYSRRPIKTKFCFIADYGEYLNGKSVVSTLNRSLFPELTFENSPKEVELKFKEV